MQSVFIHDCARPLIRPQTLTAIEAALSTFPAIALGRRMTDTMKTAEPSKMEDVFVTKPLPRQDLWAMETPQAFDRDLIQKAHENALEINLPLTDDVSAVEALDHPVRLMEAGYPNPKITSHGDILLIESLLKKMEKTT
jgi:2-C-methyl-D-erythritol 4-phosphate cytidylyltransferase